MLAWDHEEHLQYVIEQHGTDAVDIVASKDRERVKSLLKDPAQLRIADERCDKQPIMVQIDDTTAFSVPDEESWILQQSDASIADYSHFGVVGGDKYYDKLTDSALDIMVVLWVEL